MVIVSGMYQNTEISHRLGIHRCATGGSTRISGKYNCSNFNINVLQRNGFCRFISDQDKNITSFVA